MKRLANTNLWSRAVYCDSYSPMFARATPQFHILCSVLNDSLYCSARRTAPRLYSRIVHVVHAVHSTVQSVLKHCPHYANLNMRNHRKIDPLDSLKRILCNKTLLHRTVLCNKAMHPKKTQTLLKGKFPIIQFNTFNRWDERVSWWNAENQ